MWEEESFKPISQLANLQINKEILRLAIPSILANITIPLVGMVDTAIAGHIADAAAIGGIAIAGVLFSLLYWTFGFLRVGTSGLTAQAFGRAEDTTPVLFRSIRTALYGAAGILLLQYPIYLLIPLCFPSSDAVIYYARLYFLIRVWAAPATLILMATKGWFIGNQDTVSPMATDILVNLVNIAASYLLAVTFGLGVIGVAWGTIVAQYSGLVFVIWVLVRVKRVRVFERPWLAAARVGKPLGTAGLEKTAYERKKSTKLNANLFIRSLCFIVIYVAYTNLATRYGETELAVSAILMHLLMFFSYFIDGFAYAAEALVGRAVGKNEQPDREVRSLLEYSLVVGAIFALIYGVFGTELCGLFTSSDEVVATADRYRFWLGLFPLISAVAFLWDGVYAGLTAGAAIRNTMLVAVAAFGLTYVACYRWADGANAIYAAYMAHILARAVVMSATYPRMNKKAV